MGEHRRKLLGGSSLDGTTVHLPNAAEMAAHDEGQLLTSIGNDGKHVLIKFGKPVAFIGMPPKQAVQFGINIIKQAFMGQEVEIAVTPVETKQ